MASTKKLEKTPRVANDSPLSTPHSKAAREAPAKRAAAISYDPTKNDVPVLAAFGEGHIAEKIVAVARESGIPIVPDPSLSSMLAKISVGDEIPEELYEAVAKVLIFVSEVDRSYGDRLRASGMLRKQ